MQHYLSSKHNLISAFVQGPRISRAAFACFQFNTALIILLLKPGSALRYAIFYRIPINV